jgi:oligopeptidase A
MELDNTRLPAFQHIEVDHIEPTIDTLLTDNRAAIAARLQTGEPYTWENILYPLEDLQDRLDRAWSPVRHLHGVADNDALRRVYNACLSKLSDYATEVGQNEGLYRAYNYVKEHGEYERLGNAERKLIDNALRDFRLSGGRASKNQRGQVELNASGRCPSPPAKLPCVSITCSPISSAH